MSKTRIYLSSPTMHGEEQEYVKDAFDTNWIAPLGPHVNAFEKEIAEFNEVSYAAALSAGTAALHLAMRLLDIKQGDIVFAQSLTFAASCNPIMYEKATPVFIDSEADTWNMSPEALEKAYEKYPNPKAVVFVHLYGTPAKIDELMAICKKHGTPVIEDAAEALSSTYKGKKTGSFGTIGILSFNGNKIITTSGGGMLLANNEEYTKKATFLATQARDPARYYQHSTIGYNYRMSNVCAAIGRGQLIHIAEHKKKKNDIYETYKKAFADIKEIKMNPMNPLGDANNWLSCITIDPECSVTPNDCMDALAEYDIESRPIWKPMHLQPVYADYDFISVEKKNDVSVSEDIFNRGFCLPSDIKNTEEDMKEIISIIKSLFQK